MLDSKKPLEPNIPPDHRQLISAELTQAELEQRRADQKIRMNNLPKNDPVRQLYERLQALTPE